jgi:selenocysteine lyase/cysteine desulfurase
LRGRFPTLLERAYFATHCLGPVATEAFADLDEYRRTIGLRNRALETWIERIDELRGLLAQLVGADRDEIALGPNATACQANLAAALAPSGRRDTIVTTSLDFPSSRYLWHAQARRGFQIRNVVSEDGITLPVERIVASLDDRVAIVALPLVAYTNGALLRAEPIIAAAHAAGALVVLDAYQAVGIVPIDVHALGVDALVGGTHKWLGAPGTGLAFLYVRAALAEQLEPAFPGWFAHAETVGFADVFTPARGARRFEQGSPAIEAIYTARAGVKLALEVGVSRIRTRSFELSDLIIAGADALGLPLRTPRSHAERAGVVCLGVRDPDTVVAALRDRGIDVDTRPGTGIRASCHPCNTPGDCERLLEALASP